MTVKAELEGHPVDLDALAREFPTGDPHIVVTGEGTFLEATALDSMFDDAGRLVDTANEHLARLNGYAILAVAGYQAVRLTSRFVRAGGPTHVHLVAHDEARARDSVTVVALVSAETRATAFVVASVVVDGVPVAPVPPDGLRHLARATTDKNVADLLALIGNAESLGWYELYKAYEIIRDAVGGGQKGLIDGGWTTKLELSRFTGSANHPDASGAGARHARQSGGPPSNAMALGEGQQFIRDLARRWLDSLP
jgi:hypothetical protein